MQSSTDATDLSASIYIDTPDWMNSISNLDSNLIGLADIIHETIVNQPPLSLSEGGLINDGIDNVLDGLRNLIDDQDSWLLKKLFDVLYVSRQNCQLPRPSL